MINAILGPYKLVAKIGEGGMGAVYRAEHSVLRRVVAIKLLHANLTKHAQITQRFVHEAQAASMLESEHIVKVFDCQQDPASRAWWIAMEHLPGTPLSSYLATHAPLSLAEVVEIASQIAEALDEAHAHGIVHRDIKPDNVYLTIRGSNGRFVKVLDFGIAKLRRPGTAAITITNAVLGTQPYMPPEQLRGQPVDHRVDVFALGVVVYLMLNNGRHPFQNDDTLEQFYGLTAAELCVRQLSQDPTDLRSLNPAVPEPIAAAVGSALHRDREQRPRSAGDLVVELARLADQLDTVAKFSSLLEPTAARRSIQMPVPEAPVTSPPHERDTVTMLPLERATVRPGSPEYRTNTAPAVVASDTTFGSAAGQTMQTRGKRLGVIAAVASILLALAAGALVWSVRTRRVKEANVEPGDGTVVAARADSESDAAPSIATGLDATPQLDATTLLDATIAALPVDATTVAVLDAAPADAAIALDAGTYRPPVVTERPSLHVEQRTGELAVYVKPWAIVWINGRNVGQTPYREKVPVGRYRVQLKNDDKEETTFVVVTPDKTTTIQRTW
ncbi:MAG: serine/threonine protein kinase [Deltaproteobacteria bacterium]|nr:serine/threonine protein kinase [Deltaproteobacteria bacterium]